MERPQLTRRSTAGAHLIRCVVSCVVREFVIVCDGCVSVARVVRGLAGCVIFENYDNFFASD